MVTTLKPRHACVQFSDPSVPSGADVSVAAFLDDCHASALARFRARGDARLGCRTIEHAVAPKAGAAESTGLILAHVSPALCWAWQGATPGTPRQRRAHVDAELDLALTDLADQDMHGYLAVTEEQVELYEPDLVQLTHEAMDRTTFSHLGRRSDPHWEGTLVEQVRPPYLVLVLSIGFDRATPAGLAFDAQD